MKNYEAGLDILGHRGGGGGGRGRRGGRGFFGPRYYSMPYAYSPEVYLLTEDYDRDFHGPKGECLVDVDEILGDDEDVEDILGFVDIGARQREMNTLKQVPVRIAQPMIKYGQQVINEAIKMSDRPNTTKAMLMLDTALPGVSAREEVKGKLAWHANNLKKYASTPDEIYPDGDDLKKWAMQAFIEANAVEEGNAVIDAAWGAMWAEIVDQLMRLPQDVYKKVSEFSLPTWAKVAIGVGAGVVGITLATAVVIAVKK